MDRMGTLKTIPVTDELFPLLGKVYAQAWRGANSSFSTPAHLKKQTAEKKAERFKKQYKREKNLNFYLIDLDDEPIGMYSISRYPDGSGELRQLYLLPAYGGKGYGMEVLLQILWENRELEKLFLWVLGPNERAIRFYSKCGFVATGEKQEVDSSIDLFEYKMVLEGPLDVKAAVIRSLLRKSRKEHEAVLPSMLSQREPLSDEKAEKAVPFADKELEEKIADWLKTLCLSDGIPGEEDAPCAAAAGILRNYTEDIEINTGRSVIARVQKAPAGAPEVLLDAHIDEIGIMVKNVDENGFVHAVRNGGIDARLLAGQEVVIHGARRLSGVVVPPSDPEKLVDVNDVVIDTGYGKDELETLVSPGDMVTSRGVFLRLSDGKISCKALDDRSCMAAILTALELTHGETLPCGVTVLFSSQEEIGGHGAATSSFAVCPDQALVSDVSFAWTPDADRNECGLMDKGGMIGFAPILDKEMTARLKTLAAEKNIPFQYEVMSGSTGTNADNIFRSGKGVRTAMISLPQKYMHTPVEIVSIADILSVGRLMAEYLRHPVMEHGEEEKA